MEPYLSFFHARYIRRISSFRRAREEDCPSDPSLSDLNETARRLEFRCESEQAFDEKFLSLLWPSEETFAFDLSSLTRREATNIARPVLIILYITLYIINDYCYYVIYNTDGSPTSGLFFREISLSWLSNRERYLIINAYMNRSRGAMIKPALVDRAFTRSDTFYSS